VPKIIWDVPVVLPGGKISKSETYHDYFDEANAFFNAILDVYCSRTSTHKE
jgi:hypothetical protein